MLVPTMYSDAKVQNKLLHHMHVRPMNKVSLEAADIESSRIKIEHCQCA